MRKVVNDAWSAPSLDLYATSGTATLLQRPVGDQPLSLDASADPYAGTDAANGKEIWDEQMAADNLKSGYDWYHDNYGELEDGVLTYGFWTQDELLNSYYVSPDGEWAFNEAYYAQYGYFTEFNAAQQAMAASTIELWDDVMAISIEQADSVQDADITFGFAVLDPAAGASTYYPQGQHNDALYQYYYGFEEAGRRGGDVWANWYYGGDYDPELNSFAITDPGYYGWFAIAHELGHSFGLSHAGSYNASDDNDGDGKADPITYDSDAYFFQDSAQYTMMSYFQGYETGATWLDYRDDGAYWAYASTPMVHDILAVQQIYGADMTTRTGDTTYGFNSNAGMDVFDFDATMVPVLTIWDAGGNDTLDLSGYTTDSIIDLNEGAFSSAGHGITESPGSMEYYGLETQADVDAFAARNGLGPDGRPIDNIAIAYGAEIENAIGGSGDDRIIGNALDNVIKGGDGFDVVTLGAGDDVFIAELGTGMRSRAGNVAFDVITDFTSGSDLIDLSGLGTSFHFEGMAKNKDAGDLSYKVYDSITGAENALGIDIDGRDSLGVDSGPVTVVYANTDGGSPDIGIILLNHNGVSGGDFMFA